MRIGIIKETHPGEKRTALTPLVGEKFIKLGADVMVESGLGEACGFSDEAYQKSGVTVHTDATAILNLSDIILRLHKPSLEDVSKLKQGCLHISFLDPFNEKKLVAQFSKNNISAISMELIPRVTRAQKMDALSSQASLAGYVTVILAAERINKILPMMMTPSGTIAPSRVFVIGAGVAGLQAIATAKRLGARVEAFDTRPVVAEQVESLGAKFVKIDLGETGQTKDGYAKQLSAEQLEKQRLEMAKVCAQSDIVITTAQVFARRAPLILTRDIIHQMKPGSVVVDMAVESGGNVEGSQPDKEVNINGVTIIGLTNLPGRVAMNASEMYANNLYNLVSTFWNKKTGSFELKLDDDIIRGCLVTHQGKIVNEKLKATQ